ncbi:MAG: leucyl aminopeptidase [Candidatus Paracaedibacteraceae bacterium]|nr:leucyl aminopeptidase [Candidatus Paracaedibacteraceae bacterium]
MKVSFQSNTTDAVQKGILVLGAFEDNALFARTNELNATTGGQIQRALNASSFKGKKDDVLSIPVPNGLEYAQIVLVGFGKASDATPLSLEEAGAKALAVVARSTQDTLTVDLSDIPLGKEGLARFVSGIEMRSWRFDKYKTKEGDKPKGPENVIVRTGDVDGAALAFNRLHAVVEGNFLTRHVVSEPPNVIYPETMAEQAKELAALGLKVEVLDEAKMKALGMNSLLCVGQGSVRESQLIVIQWDGGTLGNAPVAIVGKGVTFDSGGISIKPSTNMEDMKYDMGGSGVVLGLMKTLALRKAKVNAVGVMGMVENMPSGSAVRPADVVKSMSGQTIEIVNTDAEGRLVLADALWYTQDRFKPQVMIDLATLTGAITVAVGYEFAGLFSNNDRLSDQLTEAGKVVGELLWRFPLTKTFDKDIDSDIADMKNVGSGRGAGSITAAQFLQRFVNNVPWAHLDIAGMAWDKKDRPLSGKGATGFGVRLLDQLIEKNFEK